jgi:hypothetical protein
MCTIALQQCGTAAYFLLHMDFRPKCFLLLVSCLGHVNLLSKYGFLLCVVIKVIKYYEISEELTVSVFRVTKLFKVGAEVMWQKV